MNKIKCPACGKSSHKIDDEISDQIFKCDFCGNEFHVRIHFVDKPIPLETKVFKALIDASDPKTIRKLQIKVKKVFEGMSNFYPADLDHQISKGMNTWDLGFYSDGELENIKLNAAKLGLIVQFVPS